MTAHLEFVAWFRRSAPYINAHRGRTFVVQFDGGATRSDHFSNLIHDLALLHMLGVRVVLVHGTGPQVEAVLHERGIQTTFREGLRVTDGAALEAVVQAVGAARIEIEAMLSMGVANSPMAGARIRVTTGNFVIARPLGVRDGVDFSHTGEVRRVDAAAIQHQLDQDAIVLISPIGYSPTGEIFNLNAANLATRLAIDCNAAKLVFLAPGLSHPEALAALPGQLTAEQARHQLEELPLHDNRGVRRLLANAVDACNGGVSRVHLIDRTIDGVLLRELYTRDGAGTMVNSDPYDSIRRATIEDVGGIIELIEPLEKAGLLVRRSRDRLEAEIDHFTVVERDGSITGSAAVYAFAEEKLAELACFAVAPDYQVSGIGAALLEETEAEARRAGANRLFVLTTQAAQWFEERGFLNAEIESLPLERQRFYNLERNSRVLIKVL